MSSKDSTEENCLLVGSPDAIAKTATKQKQFYMLSCALLLILLLSVGFVSSNFRNDKNVIYNEPSSTRRFIIDYEKKVFRKDGEPFQFVSGSLHYFRIPKIYWEDRIIKASAAGLDAITIDIPWNFHELDENVFDFSEERDLESFIYLAHKHNLLVFLRIGPYIGADWTFGGLPPWLLSKNARMKLRSSAEDFMKYVNQWFNHLLPKLKRHLYSQGGPVVLIQLENEYGSTGECDQKYWSAMISSVRKHLGHDVIITMNDLPSVKALLCGTEIKGLLPTVDFGPYNRDPEDNFHDLEQLYPNTPWVNSEYYTGWTDIWGNRHYYVPAQFFVQRLISLLSYSKRISVNIYMFHGGTNFGLMNGAIASPYVSQITSYDYNAPIAEDGDLTDMYSFLRNAIFQFKNQTPPSLPASVPKRAFGNVKLELVSHLLFHLQNGIFSDSLKSFEEVHKYEGYLVYKTSLLRNANEKIRLKFTGVADYAYVFTMGEFSNRLEFHGALTRNQKSHILKLKPTFQTYYLLILVENAGHISYENNMIGDVKGLIGHVSADNRELSDWELHPICLTPSDRPKCNTTISNELYHRLLWEPKNASVSEKENVNVPIQGAVFRGVLLLPNENFLCDTYLRLNNFTRGIVLINDVVVGRYNPGLGPQSHLYIPKSMLKLGLNMVLVIELDTLWLDEDNYANTVTIGTLSNVTFVDKQKWTGKQILSLD